MSSTHHPRPDAPRQAACCALLLLALAGPGAAAERFTLRVFGVAQSSAGDEIVLAGPAAADTARFSLADGTAVGLELGFRWKPRLELELMTQFGGYDVDLDARGAGGRSANGSLGSETYTLGVNYRLSTAGRADITVGAFGGFSYYDDVTLTHPATGRPETFRFDDDLGFGAKLGIDLALDRAARWLASGSLRYQQSILEGEIAGRDLDVDPLSVTLGVGYRF